MNNPNLSDVINEDDESAFQYLSNLVVVEYTDVKSGYKITFVSLILILCHDLALAGGREGERVCVCVCVCV